MYKNIAEIPNNIKTKVYLDYCSREEIDTIMNKRDLLRSEVLSILQEKRILKKTLMPFIGYSVNEKDLIIISDTHIGSNKANIDYIKYVYDYAHQNNIHNIIHGGDLIESNFIKDKVIEEYKKLGEQLDYCSEVYPKVEGIKTHVLLGNHDYDAILNLLGSYKEFNGHFDKRKDINILGLQKAYIKWFDNLIGVRHLVKGYDIPVRFMADITFAGHFHRYYKNFGYGNDFDIPTLSDDTHSTLAIYDPGFLVLRKVGQTAKIFYYTLDKKGGNINLTNYGKVYEDNLTKKRTRKIK